MRGFWGSFGLGGLRNRLDAVEARQAKLAEASIRALNQVLAYYRAAQAEASPGATFYASDGTVSTWADIEAQVATEITTVEALIVDLS